MSGSGATSNADQVKAALERLVASIKFQSPGKSGSLGEDCLAVVAVGIRERTVDEGKDADGRPLAANRGKYGDRKRAKGLPVGVGLRSKGQGDQGRMLSLQQVEGRREITEDTATMTHGQDDRAFEKAGWFTAGSTAMAGVRPSGAKNQPARKFYALDDDLRGKVRETCREFVADLVRKA